MKTYIITLWIVVAFLGFYCSYLMWKLQKLTEYVNKIFKEGSNENNR